MTTTSPTPVHDIAVRRPQIDHEQPLPKRFVGGHPMRGHTTARLAEEVLGDDRFRTEFATDRPRDLFTWHSLEDRDHESVTLDVYDTIGGRYIERVGTMLDGHIGVLHRHDRRRQHLDGHGRRRRARAAEGSRQPRHQPNVQWHVVSQLLDDNRTACHHHDCAAAELLQDRRARYQSSIESPRPHLDSDHSCRIDRYGGPSGRHTSGAEKAAA